MMRWSRKASRVAATWPSACCKAWPGHACLCATCSHAAHHTNQSSTCIPGRISILPTMHRDIALLMHACMGAQVAERTAADKKGGHLAKRKSDGRLILRESAQTPDEDKDAFEDVTKHKFFNTNNLWVNLDSLQ